MKRGCTRCGLFDAAKVDVSLLDLAVDQLQSMDKFKAVLSASKHCGVSAKPNTIALCECSDMGRSRLHATRWFAF